MKKLSLLISLLLIFLVIAAVAAQEKTPANCETAEDYAEYIRCDYLRKKNDMSEKSIRYSAEYILDGYPVWIG